MKVTCRSCGASHVIQPPPWVLASGRPFRMTCPSCAYVQDVHPTGLALLAESGFEVVGESPEPGIDESPALVSGPALAMPSTARSSLSEDTPSADASGEGAQAPASPAPTVAEAPSPPASGALFLRQDGALYQVAGRSTLQRWIVEKRVAPDDEVSDDGRTFQRAGDDPELALFFATVTRLEQLETQRLEALRAPAVAGPVAPDVARAAASEAPSSTLVPVTTVPDDEDTQRAPALRPSPADAPPPRASVDGLTPLAFVVAALIVVAGLLLGTLTARRFELDDVAPGSAPVGAAAAAPGAPAVAGAAPSRGVVAEGAPVPETAPSTPVAPAAAPPVAPAPRPAEPAAPPPVVASVKPAVPAPRAAATSPRSVAPAPRTPAPAVEPARVPPTPVVPPPPTPPAAPTEPPSPWGVAPTPVRSSPPPTPVVAPPPAPVAAPAPLPPPQATAPSAPVALEGLRYGGLVDAGWAAVDRRAWADAIEAFERATLLDAGGFDGRYGLGYALAKSGRRAEAGAPLCGALASAPSERDRAEVQAVLAGAGLTCR